MLFNKDTKLSIVIPCDATDREQFAATELQTYLHKIFGGEYGIYTTNEAPESAKVLIGCPRRNTLTADYISAEDFDALVPGPEGFLVKSFGDVLVLAGSATHPNELERGTIYAVYEFLEYYLGCSLSAYTKAGVAGGEYIPSYETLELNDLFRAKAKADLPYRAACAQYSSHGKSKDFKLNLAFLDWLGKNRYNVFYTWHVVYEGLKKNGMLEAATKRGILFKVGHHDAINTLLPQRGNEYFPEHYFETHPEYYKMNEDGTRFEMVSNWGQIVLCCRNDEMVTQMGNNLVEWLNQNPLVKTYAFLPKDGCAPQCCCDKCKGHTKPENFAYMINGVAKIVKKHHPDVVIDMLAYSDLWFPSERISLEDNVSITEATWHRDENFKYDFDNPAFYVTSGLRAVGKKDGSCLSNTHFEENLLNWQKTGALVYYYDYYMGVYPARQRYIPMASGIQAICKRYLEKNIQGTETQIEVFNMWNHIFNFYTFGRTHYDTNLTMEDNLESFCKVFGKGAEFIADNIRYAESIIDGNADIMYGGIYLLKHIDKERMYDGFEKALAAADTPATRNNVRLMRMAFHYSVLESSEDFTTDECGYKQLKIITTPERGELLYMRDNFDSYAHPEGDGFGIAIPIDGEPMAYEPDKWYMFE